MPNPMPQFRPAVLLLALAMVLTSAPAVMAQAVAAQSGVPAATANPYRLSPFHDAFPGELTWPVGNGAEYTRTRRQMYERLAHNLGGGVRKEAWRFATEFYWRAEEAAIEPLVETMDRAFGNAAVGDAEVVKNCVEAMARMARPEFEPALRRALLHKHPGVVQAAFAAMAQCATPATLTELAAAFPQMEERSKLTWLRAVRTRLGAAAAPLLRRLMAAPQPPQVLDLIFNEALRLPPADAAVVLRPLWATASGKLQATVAGVLHGAGDTAGTTWLADALRSEDLERLMLGVKNCGLGELGVLREPFLKASTHLRPEVRLEVARRLVGVAGDDVSDVFELLAQPDQAWEVRSLALRELTVRGRLRTVDVLLDEVKTATGMRLQNLINELSAAGDPRGVPILRQRFVEAPLGEGRPFLQALAQNQSAAAAAAMWELFLGDERLVARASNGDLTTWSYLPVLMLNLRGSERVVLDGFLALPKADWQRRARIVPTLAGYAADRTDKELQAAAVAPLRSILFDREELPQLRILCLNELARRWLTIDDALRLRNQRVDESPAMKLLLADFLNEFF
jgi:hypothetical protein